MPLFYQENEVLTLTEEMVTMPDGVRLYTHYAVPKGAKKCPTVFIRTPYGAAHAGKPHDIGEYTENPFVKRGYAVLLQHCRGKGDSEGFCIPYMPEEGTDGLATLDYLRTLPFYNGEIYLMGGSYLSTVHYSYLSERPADVKGACLPIQTDRLFYRNYRNGLNYRLNNIAWWSSMVARKYPNAKLAEAFKRPYVDAAKRVFGTEVPEFTDTLIHNTCDDFWQSDEKWNVIEAIDFPLLLIEGWYDFYVEGMTDMWRRLPEATKEKSALIIGPYGHNTAVGKDFEYPMQNADIPADVAAEWFDSIREGRPFRYAKCGKLSYYSIGADEWRATDKAGDAAPCTRFYLGDRTLANAPQAPTAITYPYDPDNLANRFKFFGIYRAHEANSDERILSFVSDTIQKEQSFLGCVRFHLNVSSDCEDTAFFARVYFVDGDAAYNLTEAMGSLSSLVGDYTPGTVATIEMQTPPIAFTLKPGMRLRIDITSESGNYLPHPNVKGHFAYIKEAKVAHNTVYTENSYIDLPLEE